MKFYIGEVFDPTTRERQKVVGAQVETGVTKEAKLPIMAALERVAGSTRGNGLPDPNEAGWAIRPLTDNIRRDAVVTLLGKVAPVEELLYPVNAVSLAEAIGSTAFKGVWVLPPEVEFASRAA